jgi:DNA polymerase-3 subunit alpha
MQIASHLAKFSLGKADLLRRAMGKKIAALMQEQSEVFVEGARSNQIPEETAKQIFELIDRFAGYGFNKSHATCYSIIAYQTAFLKAHYPKEFMASNLTSEMNNSDRIVTLIDDCRRMGIEVLPPDVNTSQANFIVSEDGIRFGLGAIKNVGLGAIQVIIQAREKVGNFKNIYDFCKRIDLRKVNKKVIESLIQVGATDSLEGTRAQQMAASPRAMQLAQSFQQSVSKGQTTIFGDTVQHNQLYPDLPAIDPWTQTEKLAREKSLLGIYISGHPLIKFQDEINAFCNPRLDHLDSCQLGQAVRVCGIVTDVRIRFDRKDKQFAFFTLEEFSGTVNIIAFSDVFEKYKELIYPESLIMVNGKLDCREDKDERSIISSDIIPLDQVRQKCAKRLSVNLVKEKIQQETLDRLNLLLRKYPGKCEVYLNLKSDNEEDLLLHSKKFRINPTFNLMRDLRQVLGKNNVWIEG